MKLQVLGTGCPKCKKLYENVEKAIVEYGGDNTLEKITDINKIVEMGAMMTPAFAINGKLMTSGKLLNVEEIKALMKKI